MKKSELANLTIGTKVISKKDESIHEVLEVTENYVQLGERAYSKSTIQRWYNIYTEPRKTCRNKNRNRRTYIQRATNNN